MFRIFNQAYFSKKPTQPPLLPVDLNKFSVMLAERKVEYMRNLFSQHTDDNIKQIEVTLELEQSEDNPTGTHREISQECWRVDLEPTRKSSLQAIRDEIVARAEADALADILKDIDNSQGKVVGVAKLN